MTTAQRVYIVVRQQWSYDDCWYHGDDLPTRAFTRREAAEEFAKRCEAELTPIPYEQTETRFVVVEMAVDAPGHGPQADSP
jgi:hypothetical protein